VHNLTHLEAPWNKWCTIIFSVEIVDVHVFTNLINRVYRNCEVCTVGSKKWVLCAQQNTIKPCNSKEHFVAIV